MVKVSGGKFKAGPDKKEVEIKDFHIDVYEVTNAEYKKVDNSWEFAEGRENHPVAEISYFDAEAYCKAVGKRLPTGAEWEKAARGDDNRAYPWGDTFEAGKANTMETGIGDTVPVGSYEAGKASCGALDMSGNVFEWVDEWDSAEKKYRILMGGSYFDDQGRCTILSTLKSIPDDTHPYSGFRCAK